MIVIGHSCRGVDHGGFLEHISITFIDKTDISNWSHKKVRLLEMYRLHYGTIWS